MTDEAEEQHRPLPPTPVERILATLSRPFRRPKQLPEGVGHRMMMDGFTIRCARCGTLSTSPAIQLACRGGRR